MNSLVHFLSKGRGFTSVFFLCLAGQKLTELMMNAVHAENDTYVTEDLNKSKKIAANKMAKNPQETQLKRIAAITQQSFKDMNYQGLLSVQFSNEGSMAAVNYDFFYKNKGVTVEWLYPESLKLSDEEIYFIAGHEAAHVTRQRAFALHDVERALTVSNMTFFTAVTAKLLYRHQHLPALQKMNTPRCILASIAISAGILGATKFSTKLLANNYNKMLEIDADVASAQQLNAHQGGISYFSTQAMYLTPALPFATFFNTHPRADTRAIILKSLKNNQPSLFFKSETYKKIKLEDQKSINDNNQMNLKSVEHEATLKI